ncbi:hypothetical protein VTN02DRAFT_1854 [Thermoascus thermophilus]
MHLNAAAVLLAFSSIASTYAVPVSSQQGKVDALHRRKTPYSVVAVDGGEQGGYAPVETETTTTTITEIGPRLPPVTVTVTETPSSSKVQVSSSSVPTATLYHPSGHYPVAPGSTGVPFYRYTPSPTYAYGRHRRDNGVLSDKYEATRARRLPRSLETGTSVGYGFEVRDYNRTYAAPAASENIKRSAKVSRLGVRSPSNTTSTVVRSYHNGTFDSIQTLVKRSVATGSVNRSGIKRGSNVTYHMPIPVQALSIAIPTPTPSSSSFIDLPTLPPQASQTPDSWFIPRGEFPHHRGNTTNNPQ